MVTVGRVWDRGIVDREKILVRILIRCVRVHDKMGLSPLETQTGRSLI